jgi:hypothetical protein
MGVFVVVVVVVFMIVVVVFVVAHGISSDLCVSR